MKTIPLLDYANLYWRKSGTPLGAAVFFKPYNENRFIKGIISGAFGVRIFSSNMYADFHMRVFVAGSGDYNVLADDLLLAPAYLKSILDVLVRWNWAKTI